MSDDTRLREITAEEAQREQDQALADAAALDRLAAYPEWIVLDRLMHEHAQRVIAALRTRGLDGPTTEALRAELDTIDWLRYRPIALRQAMEAHDKLVAAQAEARARAEKVGSGRR